MEKSLPSKSGPGAPAGAPRKIRNTFAPNCRNEYFVPATLYSMCRFGFPFKDLPEGAKELVREYSNEYDRRFARRMAEAGGGYPPVPSGPDVRIA